MLTLYVSYLKKSTMGVPKRLTEMQQRFAEFLVFGDENGQMTKTEAALKAGYSPKRARQE